MRLKDVQYFIALTEEKASPGQLKNTMSASLLFHML